MEQIITNLEQQLSELKKAYAQKQKEDYEKSTHKQFVVGDWVTDGHHIGVVGWVENKCYNCLEENGYMGVALKNGRFGFLAFAKRDVWKLLEDNLLEYYTGKTRIEIELTGEEINLLKYKLGGKNGNPSTMKSKLIDVLDATSNH